MFDETLFPSISILKDLTQQPIFLHWMFPNGMITFDTLKIDSPSPPSPLSPSLPMIVFSKSIN